MEPFRILTGVAAPMDRPNVDTDQILPARFLRKPRNDGYEKYLFHDLRLNDDGSEKPDFVLNQAPYRSARIIVAAENFGGGSSRENAPWGLVDYGIRCVIAPSFGDIFFFNAMKNGLLPVPLAAELCAALRAQLHAAPGASMTVDLPAQTVVDALGESHPFEIDAFRKRCLVEGLDEVGLTLQYEAEIGAFQSQYRSRFDWLFGPQPGPAATKSAAR